MCTTKTPDRNVLKLDTVVVLDTLSQPTDFGFKRSRVRVRVRVRESAPIASEGVLVSSSYYYHYSLLSTQ